ncbi:hypothetical protein EV586_105218 [Tumebacillus sp. BK434]|uniref:phospholipase D-like domain-containing protein DpdK n=1 Tax=Tumebacillus sp. BK434 TaxID=2512169 RepID=UPI00104B6A65|nr:phospholipase D-like domain-containing protein DpdK [Tumebacillus sp. BK434]TCP53872.1 hypothetical protein EV586_105218 [Tumebacillus sp. BK434]
MSEYQPRIIYTHNSTREAGELLQSLFTAELVRPSRSLWLVSPWIYDIDILDNRGGQFFTFEPHWPHRKLRLSEVISRMVENNTHVHIISRDNVYTRPFLASMRGRFGDNDPRLMMKTSALLHVKGLLGDGYFLSGSMNFTYSGITINEEKIHFTTDAAEVATNRNHLETKWGGSIR